MDTVIFERAVEVVRALGPEEQARLRALMDAWMMDSWQALEPRPAPPQETTPAQEQAFAEHLMALGMLDHIPEGYPAGYADPPLIVVQGEPVSETVLRERR